jgi:hypothetical protein
VSFSAASVTEALLLAEKQIRLLERVQPLGLAAELERLVAAWERGNELFPQLRYGHRPDFTRLRDGLAMIGKWGESESERMGIDALWLASRAYELSGQAELVESLGTRRFGHLAQRLFPAPTGERASYVKGLVDAWKDLKPDSLEPKYRSDDGCEPKSLYSLLRIRLVELGLRAEIRIETALNSVAATANGQIRILASTRLTEFEARRIVEHEVLAHLIPRLNATRANGPLKCGCALASADEEGRALLIEERVNLMNDRRKHELALRHRANDSSRGGANFVEVVRELLGFGASVSTALKTALRCFRGSVVSGAEQTDCGGLGREVIYIPSYLRIKAAFIAHPALEQWFERGRASLEYALTKEGIQGTF